MSVNYHEQQKEKFDFSKPANKNVVHFVQSSYAYEFLKQKRVENIYYLRDHINPLFLKKGRLNHKRDIVLYTPFKGAGHYIEQLIKINPSLHWVPLMNMSIKMLAKKMRESKIYIDFGSHPGRDRMPREAAVSGCCVITSLSGSARFEEDIPIPRQYKFDLQEFDTEKVMDKIQDCLTNYEVRIRDFDRYADIIRGEERRFEYEIKSIFGLKALKNKPPLLIVLKNCRRFVKESAASKCSAAYIIEKLCKECLSISLIMLFIRMKEYLAKKLTPRQYAWLRRLYRGFVKALRKITASIPNLTTKGKV